MVNFENPEEKEFSSKKTDTQGQTSRKKKPKVMIKIINKTKSEPQKEER